jgi:hypothetical protein
MRWQPDTFVLVSFTSQFNGTGAFVFYSLAINPGLRIRITLIKIRSRIQLFTEMLIRIRILIKVMIICDCWSTEGSIFSLHGSIVCALCPPRLHFEPLELLNFDFNADPDPAFHSHAVPDPQPCYKPAEISKQIRKKYSSALQQRIHVIKLVRRVFTA